MQRILVFAAGIAICAALGVFFLHEGRERSDQWASVFGAFLNITAIILTINAAIGVRHGLAGQHRPDVEYLENLATAASCAYAAEAAVRQLQDPDLLPVDWRLANLDLMDHPANIWPDAYGSPPDLRRAPSVLETYLQVPAGRLVFSERPARAKVLLR